jgi:hypothetical protein
VGGLFGGFSADDRDAALVKAYERAGRTLDDLPYTPEFDAIYAESGGDEAWTSRREAFHRLHNLRKASKLPRMGRAAGESMKVTAAEEARLTEMVTARVGTLGQRDQLIFTPAFDEIVQAFNAATGRSLSPHDLWRLLAKIAK